MTTLHELLSDEDVDILAVKQFIKDHPQSVNAYEVYYSALDKAISIWRLDLVELLVNSGASLNQTDSMGMSALLLAIEEGCLKIARYLIDVGANLHQVADNGWGAIHYSIYSENQNMVEMIIRAGVDLTVKVGGQDLVTFAKIHGAEVAPWLEGFLKAKEEQIGLEQALKKEEKQSDGCASPKKSASAIIRL